jgi:hypothetical protein
MESYPQADSIEQEPQSSAVFESLRKNRFLRPLILVLMLDVLAAAYAVPKVLKARMDSAVNIRLNEAATLKRSYDVARYEKDRAKLQELLGDSNPLGISPRSSEELRAEADKMGEARESFSYLKSDVVPALNIEEKLYVRPDIEAAEIGDFASMKKNGEEVLVSKDDIRSVITQTLPQGWGDGVISIEQVDHELPLDSNYGLSEDWLTTAHIKGASGSKSIEFSKHSTQDAPASILNKVLLHEIGHSEDWVNNISIPAHERAELLLKVIKRVKAKNRYRSEYVESIRSKDKQQQLYLKSQEYWAEICTQYFADASRLNIADFKLVDEYVKDKDPNFDTMQASKIRNNIIREIASR